MYRRSLPEGEDRDMRASLEARWHAANKYTDITPLWTAKYKTLEHLMIYLTIAKAHGDPNRERYASARKMVGRLKEEIRTQEQAGREAADPSAGTANPLLP